MSMDHINYLSDVATADVDHVKLRENTYRGSWKKRGGVGAFMMLARKWDRLENILSGQVDKYDIFEAIEADPLGSDGSVLAEVRDLRQYLLLVEAEMMARKKVELVFTHRPVLHPVEDDSLRPGTPADGGHHARQLPEELNDPEGVA